MSEFNFFLFIFIAWSNVVLESNQRLARTEENALAFRQDKMVVKLV